MAQNMYPSNVDVDDPSPEVQSGDSLSNSTDKACCYWVFILSFCALCLKDIDSTSGSGHESFYTPEPSPTDKDSSSSGGLLSFCVQIIKQILTDKDKTE